MSVKRNAPCVIVKELPFDAPPGHTMYRRNDTGVIERLAFGCPCGCGTHYGAVFVGPNPWTFDGNVERPTVTPSLGCYPNHESPVGPDGTYHWHGYLKAGLFEEC